MTRGRKLFGLLEDLATAAAVAAGGAAGLGAGRLHGVGVYSFVSERIKRLAEGYELSAVGAELIARVAARGAGGLVNVPDDGLGGMLAELRVAQAAPRAHMVFTEVMAERRYIGTGIGLCAADAAMAPANVSVFGAGGLGVDIPDRSVPGRGNDACLGEHRAAH